jgi:hypothetical protein
MSESPRLRRGEKPAFGRTTAGCAGKLPRFARRTVKAVFDGSPAEGRHHSGAKRQRLSAPQARRLSGTGGN